MITVVDLSALVDDGRYLYKTQQQPAYNQLAAGSRGSGRKQQQQEEEAAAASNSYQSQQQPVAPSRSSSGSNSVRVCKAAVVRS